jgi:hypothetical protein
LREWLARTPQAVYTEYDQGQPDETKAYQACSIEHLIEKPQAAKELQAGADVLQQTHGAEWQASGACGKQQ